MGNSVIFPAPKPTYQYDSRDETLQFLQRDTLSVSQDQLMRTKCLPFRTIKYERRESPYLIILFHGNSEDIGTNLKNLCEAISERFGANVIAPEYPTYGIYKQKNNPKQTIEQNILLDAERLLEYAHETLKYRYDQIILVGRSLGTSVALHTASKFRVKGIILISAFTSIREVAKGMVGLLSIAVPNVFKSIEVIPKVKSPILLIHGEKDTFVPCAMSITLYLKARVTKELRLNPNMGHSGYDYEDDIFSPMEEFFVNKLDMAEHVLQTELDGYSEKTEEEIKSDNHFKANDQEKNYNREMVDFDALNQKGKNGNDVTFGGQENQNQMDKPKVSTI